MTYQLRPYQKDASDAAINAISGQDKNGIIVLPTGSGKSIVIADIASRIKQPLLVLQPSKEILEQNYKKYMSYDCGKAGIYSASVGVKDIQNVTFAMIGSVLRHIDDFEIFKIVIIDECHLVKPDEGMYKKFISATKRVVIGLTATPYRLYSNIMGSQLKFITRTRPRIFTDVLYCCQVSELLSKGYLAKLNYYDITKMDMTMVASNSTGADYDDKSLQAEYKRIDFHNNLVSTIKRIMKPKSGIPRNGILVFTKFVEEAEKIKNDIGGCAIVTGDMNKHERESVLSDFKDGKIKVIANVGVLTTGFDYPELDTVIMARPTKSLSLWYQCVGRAIRPCKGKEGWIVDMCGNIKRFGKVEDLRVENRKGWCVTSNGKQLTNVFL